MNHLIEYAKKELKKIDFSNNNEEFFNTSLHNYEKEIINLLKNYDIPKDQVIKVFALLINHKPLSPLTGLDEEWEEDEFGLCQNLRQSNIFKIEKNAKPYYMDAVLFKKGYEFFSGTVGSITSKQYVKFPFTPKTFILEVDKHNKIINQETIKEINNYYNGSVLPKDV